MNDVEMYSKWSQGNQGSYQVQFAQYTNCIFWSDNPYVSDVKKRTNYTLYYTSQVPLCYSNIPDNTFKAFYLAASVVSDPNWGNPLYKESFAKATWATQAFSYYGARTIGLFGHDAPGLNITLPKDCRGLMYGAMAIENAGTFDATNTTKFGAKAGSWQEAFGECISLRNLYIKNLKTNLNLSWSPIGYESIYFIISEATNENAITISLSPYTYNLLRDSDFELAASKNITIELIASNYTEDKRWSEIANKADKEHTHNIEDIDGLESIKTQSDWNINDETNPAFVKNRPFYTTETETTLLAETSITIYKANYAYVPLGNTFSLEVGKSYKVIFDGVMYECIAFTHTDSKPAIGNQNIPKGSQSGNEPFFINGSNWIYSSQQGNHTISIIGTHEEFITLSEGFIPDTIARVKNIAGLKVEGKEGAEIFNDYEDNTATGEYSHAEGSGTTASGHSSHTEGYITEASGNYSHAEGYDTEADRIASHAEGYMTYAHGDYSHAEGVYTTTFGEASHAEGSSTYARGFASHAEGDNTKASGDTQHVQGKYNIEDTENKYAHIVGNGSNEISRSNAHTLDWSGNAWFAGKVYVGGTSQDDAVELSTGSQVQIITWEADD